MASDENASREAGAAMPANPPRENLYRATQETIELTRADGEAPRVLTGHAAVFNQWTEINSIYEGRFMERIAPGAFTKTISENRDRIKVLFNHGQDPQIGDKPLGPLRALEEDEYGVRYDVDLLDTSYNRDLIPGLEAGVYSASFRFSVMQEAFDKKPARSEFNPMGIPERTLKEVRLAELGPVTFPAYPGATAGMRSMTDEFLFGRFVDDPERLAELLAMYHQMRNAEPDPSEDTTPDADEQIEPEPSAATTRAKRGPKAPLYTTNREEKPGWLL